MKFLIVLILLVSNIWAYNQSYSFRKYNHIKNFYEPIIKDVIKIGIKYNIPPAAILAIASVESGYGRGYVASITGNILSLDAGKSDAQLPSLYLPHKNNPYEVLYNQKQIKAMDSSTLIWKQRPKSLKKDYRPKFIAGSKKELDYFDYNQKEKYQAQLKNIEDFCTKWISLNNTYQVFRDAKKMLDNAVQKDGKQILFSQALNERFIQSIGGKKNSFNFRASWSKKVITVLKKTGLTALTKDIFNKKSFQKSW